jgi:hypothetical protein
MTELSDLGPPGALPAAKDVVIECEMQEAEALREIARKNCPEAIADITEGISTAVGFRFCLPCHFREHRKFGPKRRMRNRRCP